MSKNHKQYRAILNQARQGRDESIIAQKSGAPLVRKQERRGSSHSTRGTSEHHKRVTDADDLDNTSDTATKGSSDNAVPCEHDLVFDEDPYHFNNEDLLDDTNDSSPFQPFDRYPFNKESPDSVVVDLVPFDPLHDARFNMVVKMKTGDWIIHDPGGDMNAHLATQIQPCTRTFVVCQRGLWVRAERAPYSPRSGHAPAENWRKLEAWELFGRENYAKGADCDCVTCSQEHVLDGA